MKKRKKRREDTTDNLLKKILITQLAIARVSQDEIGRIVGISKGSVNAIARHVRLPKLSKIEK